MGDDGPMDDPPASPTIDPAARPAARALLGPIAWGRGVLLPIGVGAVVAAALVPIDGPLTRAVRAVPLPGDVRRELELLQQFGSPTIIALAFLFMLCLDPGRARRVLDWLLAAGIGLLVFNAMKGFIGRLRPDPSGGDPLAFLGPAGLFTTDAGAPPGPAWHVWDNAVLKALSMPSTHTTHAAIAAAFLACVYPRLRRLVIGWAVLVAFARVRLGAHWPSDVALGAGLGWALGWLVTTRWWGVRGLDWVWVTLVDRRAEPMFPRMIRRERGG